MWGFFYRYHSMFDLKLFKKKASEHSSFFLAACDEVGRGPLAGPVVAACTSVEIKNFDELELKALLKVWAKLGVTDSKKLKSKERSSILSKFSIVKLEAFQNYTIYSSKNIHIVINIQEISPVKIDQINILEASLLAMKEAMLASTPSGVQGLILIDGNKKLKVTSPLLEQMPIVKGDLKSLLIGLASIFAKEYRDELMRTNAQLYPVYGWEQNAGYPTKKHLEAISEYGITKLHRLTFKGVKEIYETRGYN